MTGWEKYREPIARALYEWSRAFNDPRPPWTRATQLGRSPFFSQADAVIAVLPPLPEDSQPEPIASLQRLLRTEAQVVPLRDYGIGETWTHLQYEWHRDGWDIEISVDDDQVDVWARRSGSGTPTTRRTP